MPIPLPGQHLQPAMLVQQIGRAMRPDHLSLTRQAARLYPESPVLQERWMRSVNFLRGGRGWILDQGTPAPSWHARPAA